MQQAMRQRTRHTAEEPFAALYRRFGPTIHRRARALLQDDQEALDVTQDTFLDYWRWQPSMRGEASPFTVLYQIATNKAVDRIRRNSRWSGVLRPLDLRQEEDDARPSSAASTNEGGMARVEALRDLSLLTEGESPQAICAAVLYFVEGYTLQETGQVLDLDRKAVSALLHQFAERTRQRSARLPPGGPS